MKWLIAAAAMAAAACSPPLTGVTKFTASHAEIAKPRGGSGITAAYVTLESPVDDRIVGVSSPQARAVEMHEMERDGDVMKMKQVEGLDLKAGVPLKFQQGGLHLMVFDPLPGQPGATFPIIFQLQSGGSERVEFAFTP